MSTIGIVFFFFFQAEDGIRDRNVTGVQTCALPISLQTEAESPEMGRARHHRPGGRFLGDGLGVGMIAVGGEIELLERSEERRVGKECRSGGSAYNCKKKKEGWRSSRVTLVDR